RPDRVDGAPQQPHRAGERQRAPPELLEIELALGEPGGAPVTRRGHAAQCDASRCASHRRTPRRPRRGALPCGGLQLPRAAMRNWIRPRGLQSSAGREATETGACRRHWVVITPLRWPEVASDNEIRASGTSPEGCET